MELSILNKFFKVTCGGSRFIIMIGNLVFKFPRLHCFKYGVIQNKYENLHKNDSKYLTKLYFSAPFGLCNVTERVTPFTVNNYNERYENLDFIKNYYRLRVPKEELDFLLYDGFLRNFGMRNNGEIVKLDWGYGHESM